MSPLGSPAVTPHEQAREAADTLAGLTGVEGHDVALVLGSGWRSAAEALGEPVAEIESTDLPGFSAVAVTGHSGSIRSVRLGDRRLLMFGSRTHYYEGKGVPAGGHPIPTPAAPGRGTNVPPNRCGRAAGDGGAGEPGPAPR